MLQERTVERVGVASEVEVLVDGQYAKLVRDEEYSPFAMEKTGFSLMTQVGVLGQEMLDSRMGLKTFEEARENFVEKFREDAVGFYMEYLAGFAVLPIRVEWGSGNDEGRLVCAKYGGERWLDIISESEREGSVKLGMERLEQRLLDLGPGSVAYVTSPAGWSGMGYEYPVSQTYIFRVDEDGDVEALTIRSNMNLEQNEELVGTVGDGWEQGRIREVVETVGVRDSRMGEEYGFDDVLSSLVEMVGETVLFDADTGKIYSAHDVKEEIGMQQEMKIVDGQIEGVLARFEEYVEEYVDFKDMNEEMVFELMVEMGRAVLDLSIVMGDVDGELHDELRYGDVGVKNEQYGGALNYVRQKGGCAGGGVKKHIKGEKIACYKCGKCGVVGMVMLIGPRHYYCGACGASKKL